MVKFLKKHAFLLLCFLAAAMYLLFSSKSSPMYPMNDWVDVNCFYTMGKSLLAGLVPYRDLYEPTAASSESGCWRWLPTACSSITAVKSWSFTWARVCSSGS